MRLELALAGIGMALVLVSAAARGEAPGGGVPADVVSGVLPATANARAPAAAAAGALETLSPGNRLIARALFAAQKAPAPDRARPWSLDDIAAARAAGANWGEIFRRLKADRLVEAETLGQVVTWYQYHSVLSESGRSSVMSTAVAAPAGRNQTAP